MCSYSVVAFYSSSIAVFSTAPPHRLVFYTSVTRPARTRPIVRARLEFASREYKSALQPPQTSVRSLLTAAATLSAIHSTIQTRHFQYGQDQASSNINSLDSKREVERTSIG